MDPEENDGERNEIRGELSTMSFEDLQKLKETLGSKVYNEAMFGVKQSTVKHFKRQNKNRPREISSKTPESLILPKLKKTEVRDPRFDSLSGSFNERTFREDYKFLNDIEKQEMTAVFKQLKEENDPNEKKKLKLLLQRLKNKKLETRKKEKKEKERQDEVEEKIKCLNEGKKPYFRTKLEKKIAGLVEQYSELKHKGKLQKHIQKQRKRLGQKDKKSGFLEKFP